MKMPLHFNNLAQEPILDYEINLDELRIASTRRKKHNLNSASKAQSQQMEPLPYSSPNTIRKN